MNIARLVGTAGGVLQLVGVAMVFWEIWGVQRLLKHQTWPRAVAEATKRSVTRLLVRLHLKKPTGRDVDLEAALSFQSSLQARIKRGVADEASATIEERLAAHRQRIDELDRQIEELRTETSEQHVALVKTVQDGAAETRQELRRLTVLVDRLGSESLGIRAAGVVLILAGTLLTILSLYL